MGEAGQRSNGIEFNTSSSQIRYPVSTPKKYFEAILFKGSLGSDGLLFNPDLDLQRSLTWVLIKWHYTINTKLFVTII